MYRTAITFLATWMRFFTTNHGLLKMAAALVLFVIALLAASLKTNVRTVDTDTARFKVSSASLLASIKGSKCTIEYSNTNGQSASIDLAQTFLEFPILLLPITNGDFFFCVYYNDIDIQLIRFNPRLPFSALPHDNPIRSDVIASTCDVERVPKGSTNDWAFVASALKAMSHKQFEGQSIPILDLVVYRKFFKQSELVTCISNYGDQGQYPGDVYVPWYMKGGSGETATNK